MALGGPCTTGLVFGPNTYRHIGLYTYTVGPTACRPGVLGEE